MNKKLFGRLLILVGIVVGIYVSVWVCLVGGILGLIEIARSTADVVIGLVVWNIIKIFCSGLFGWLSAVIFVIPGLAMLDN